MFEWIKRLLQRDAGPTAEEIARARAEKRRGKRPNVHANTGPTPLPQVHGEGNSESDWSEWESSMMGLDSQMQGLPDSARVYEKEGSNRYTQPAPLDQQEDSFSKVGKNRDI